MKMRWFIGLILGAVISTGVAWAQESQGPLSLEESIKIAMERSLTINSAVLGIEGSEYVRKQAITNFLPQLTGTYSGTRYSVPLVIATTPISIPGVTSTSRDIYRLATTANQPLFTGGFNLATYRSAKMGVDLSKEGLETAKRDLILQVRVGYFTVLRAEKFLLVAQQQVEQFQAQLDVTKSFFDVGIVPKNDVLQAEVNLANAKQALVKAANDLATAKASFNILLRREIDTPFEVVDILVYEAFPLSYEQSLEEAFRLRPEIKTAQLNIDQAKENVKIAASGFFPTVNLSGVYNRNSDEPELGGMLRTGGWSIGTTTSFTLWNWGNTAFKVAQNKVTVKQAENSKTQLIESITLEVKDDYLNMQVAEKNIKVAETAIEQAEENLRMTQERYRFQVSTQTDVIIAVTLLTQAKTNYYGALSDFNVAKAQLERGMGRMYP